MAQTPRKQPAKKTVVAKKAVVQKKVAGKTLGGGAGKGPRKSTGGKTRRESQLPALFEASEACWRRFAGFAAALREGHSFEILGAA